MAKVNINVNMTFPKRTGDVLFDDNSSVLHYLQPFTRYSPSKYAWRDLDLIPIGQVQM